MRKATIFILLFSLLISGIFFSKTGKEILDEMEEKNQEFSTSKQVYELTLIDSSGKVENVKEMETYILVNEENGSEKESYTMIRIVKPRNLDGTTVMTLSENEQYVYIPSYRKVKKITGSSKNDKFLDTDLKYSDITLLSGEIKQDNEAKLIEENEKNYVVKVSILDDDTDYSYLIMTIEKGTFHLQLTEFFDKDSQLVKAMKATEYKKIDGYTIFSKLELSDIQTGHKTHMDLLSAEFDIPITKKFYSTLNMTSNVLRYR